MKPLAYLMRPHHFDDIVGQDHLVGENGIIRKMILTNHLFSFILWQSWLWKNYYSTCYL